MVSLAPSESEYSNLLDPEGILRVVNQDPIAHTVKWNSRRYKLEPGKDVFIPAACAYTWFGDPRSTNIYQSITTPEGTVYFVPDRASEVRRLRIKYGGGFDGDEQSFDGVPALPNVEVYDTDGNRVTTVLDDPTGDSVTPALITTSDETDLRKTVAQQQRLIAALMEANGMNEDGTAKDESELPADGGELVTNGGTVDA